jgi:hypothetical protein
MTSRSESEARQAKQHEALKVLRAAPAGWHTAEHLGVSAYALRVLYKNGQCQRRRILGVDMRPPRAGAGVWTYRRNSV